MAETISTINIVNRTTFDNIEDKNNNIYFVREGTEETSKMLSLYFGDKRECDVLDISNLDTLDLNEPDNNYGIPDEYKVEGKILLAKQTIDNDIFYTAFAWDGSSFINCFGTPNNVIVCDSLPSTGIKDSVYIAMNSKWMYVFDGTSYVRILSSEDYATIDYVNSIYNTLLTIINEASTGGGATVGPCILMLYGTSNSIYGNVTIIEES